MPKVLYQNSRVELPTEATYTSSNARYIGAAAALNVTLSASDLSQTGQKITIKDESGSASAANPVIITGASGALIDGQSSINIENGYGYVTVISNGTAWSIIGQSSSGSNGSGGPLYTDTRVITFEPNVTPRVQLLPELNTQHGWEIYLETTGIVSINNQGAQRGVAWKLRADRAGLPRISQNVNRYNPGPGATLYLTGSSNNATSDINDWGLLNFNDSIEIDLVLTVSGGGSNVFYIKLTRQESSSSYWLSIFAHSGY